MQADAAAMYSLVRIGSILVCWFFSGAKKYREQVKITRRAFPVRKQRAYGSGDGSDTGSRYFIYNVKRRTSIIRSSLFMHHADPSGMYQPAWST